MAAYAKILTDESRSLNENWTVVLPRRGRQNRNLPKILSQEQKQSWVPSDISIDPVRESKLIQKMQIRIEKVKSSQFYHNFMEQIESTPIIHCFNKVLGQELKMKMVIYGIGSIETYENPRLQLSLAILMKIKFDWIESVEVFDPILSKTECRVLETFGCSVLSVNEQGRRRAVKPMLFFMPHCEAELYNNLLHENWSVDLLNHVILFGNSFETYELHVSEFKNSSVVDSARYIFASKRFRDEFRVDMISDDYFGAFHDSSWHFFNPLTEADLQYTVSRRTT